MNNEENSDYRIVKEGKWFVVEKKVEENIGFIMGFLSTKKTKTTWKPCNSRGVPISISIQPYTLHANYASAVASTLYGDYDNKPIYLKKRSVL